VERKGQPLDKICLLDMLLLEKTGLLEVMGATHHYKQFEWWWTNSFHIKAIQILKGSISFHFNDSIIEINIIKYDKLYIAYIRNGGFENLLKEEDEKIFILFLKLI
jgi:hypothetical protein